MGFIILDSLEFHGIAVVIEPHFYFRKIKVERAMLESLLPQQLGEFPSDVQSFTQSIATRGLEIRVSLLVGKAVFAANHAAGKARAFCDPVSIEMNKHR